MRKTIRYISFFALLLILGSCDDFLSLEPRDKISPDAIFATEEGLKTALANVYSKMPMEDFNYRPNGGYNQRPGVGGGSDGGAMNAGLTDEAEIHSNGQGSIQPGSQISGLWNYGDMRQINIFFESLDDLKAKGKITEAKYNMIKAEATYIRAYIYFQMARRYGGVPIITDVQDMPTDGNIAPLQVFRNTEKETWDFVLSELDDAIANLPAVNPDGTYRVNKYAALALKSRAALHAGSVAKYWSRAALTGDAVDLGLVGGMSIADANNYYLQCITASKDVIDNAGKALYKPTPANPNEAAKNYQDMFETPSLASTEVIYSRAYLDGTGLGGQQGHNTDYWYYPQQAKFHTFYHFARFGATLEMVDLYEDYTDDGTGASRPIRTRVDGNESVYISNPKDLTSLTASYIPYAAQGDPFVGKDARLRASIILPGSTFHQTVINMQGGMVKTTGRPVIYTADQETVGGVTYYTFGASTTSGTSGFALLGGADANFSATGFGLRKFLQDTKDVTNKGPYGSTQPFIEFRLAEIYLNYAEAAIESGQGDAALASTYLNAIRRRAGHTDNIPATLDNIYKERKIELVFEGQYYWDLIRRREMHTKFNVYYRKSLIPVIDLRLNPPQYIFLRVINYYDQVASGRTFQPQAYYHSVSGTSTNPNLVQNPGY